jgi:DNA-binding winged helix-turn-helix (wHTH) protein/tetratricopeptide (TPR) repeat protein/TolB-like protein
VSESLSATSATRRLWFGSFALDPETGRLFEGDRLIPLGPKPFELLYYLAQRPGRVVAKTELMEHVWADAHVMEGVLAQSVVDIRRALRDNVKSPQFIATLPRRGYQFVARVTTEPVPAPDETLPAALPKPKIAPRPARGFGLVATVIVALTIWLARGLPTWRAAASPLPPEPGSLLVMPIVVTDSSPAASGWLRNGLAEMIRAQLGQTNGIQVIPPHRLSAILKANDSETGQNTDEMAARLARQLRAEWLVTGSYVRLDDRFVLTAQLVEVATARTKTSALIRGNHPSDVLDGVDGLCRKLASSLRPGAEEPDWQPTGLATRSVEASRHYVEALEIWTMVGGEKGGIEAESRLDRALALDPAFAQAYLKKAEIQYKLARSGHAEQDPRPTLRAAASLAKDLPERERLLLESFDALMVRNDLGVALQKWQHLLQVYPTYAQEAAVPSLTVEALAGLGRWEDLIHIGRTYVDSPWLVEGERAAVSVMLAQAYRRKGEMGPALEQARRAVSLWPVKDVPDFWTQRAVLGRMSLDAGEREQALIEFRSVADASGADVANLAQAAWGLYMAGELEEGARLAERTIALEREFGNAHHLLGWIRLVQGRYADAARSLEAAFAKTTPTFGQPHHGQVGGDLAALYYAGVAHQKSGNRAKAEAVFARLIDRCRRIESEHHTDAAGAPFRWQAANFIGRAQARLGRAASDLPRLQDDDATYFVQSARLHAVQGRRDLALRELGQGLALGFGELRHISDDPDFESLKDVPEFRELVTEPAIRLRVADVR